MLSMKYIASLVVVLLQQSEVLLMQSTSICNSDNQLSCYAKQNPFGSFSYATTASGRIFPDLITSQTVGRWGSPLLNDVYLIERLQKFNRERIIPRVAHAKASGAFGYFVATADVSKYTKAKVLQRGKTTKVVSRFSTQVGERGSADTAVDARGFAVKFYTEEGNYDFVGLNYPVSVIRDAMLIPDIVHTRTKNPQTHQLNFNAYWDVASERPETFIFTLFVFSRTAFPQSNRYMDGHAINTFKLVNRRNETTFAKFILTSHAKDKKYFNVLEALNAAGLNTEFHTKELYDSIAAGLDISWTLNLQLITRSPDRLLSARMFASRDAQSYRLGINAQQIPVNRCPFGKLENYDRDGFMNVGTNGGNAPNYFPNTFNGLSNNDNPYYNEQPYKVSAYVDRYELNVKCTYIL